MRYDSHQALHLALEPESRNEFLRQAREGRIVSRHFGLDDEVFLLPPIAGVDPEPPAEGGLVRGPFGSQQGILLLERLCRLGEPLARGR